MNRLIKQLKNGALLVMLEAKENSINALKKNDYFEMAELVEFKQHVKNSKIVTAFRNNFTFCPVYFFYDSYIDRVLSNQITDVVFLNDNMKLDSSIKFCESNYLFSEFGAIRQDTAKYFSHSYYDSGSNGMERRSVYNGGPDMRFEALIIMSKQMIQLKRPFPYYVKTQCTIPFFKRSTSKVVNRMNVKLFKYYEKIKRIRND